MKKIFLAAIICLTAVAGATAQGRLGAYVGANLSSLEWTHGDISSDYRPGYEFGVAFEYIIPRIHVGVESGVGVLGRYYQYTAADEVAEFPIGKGNTASFHYECMEVPVHVKVLMPYIMGGVKSVVPYIYGGPSMNFVMNKSRRVSEFATYRAFNLGWDLGLGVRIINHLQIGVDYRLTSEPSIRTLVGVKPEITDIRAKARAFSLRAAWFF